MTKQINPEQFVKREYPFAQCRNNWFKFNEQTIDSFEIFLRVDDVGYYSRSSNEKGAWEKAKRIVKLKSRK